MLLSIIWFHICCYGLGLSLTNPAEDLSNYEDNGGEEQKELVPRCGQKFWLYPFRQYFLFTGSVKAA